ncbi:hypothetical protein [uncultured Streptomyces sp.]|uniref:hypothetical protein n=1 Tax=uncultured Streptomyces sp. TaxID=174707 RepID=UPI00262354C7|nr:hypothetical protein [uncultured Streptomyces sp.]
MSMIISASDPGYQPPTSLFVFLALLGVGALVYGGRWAFDVRGAVASTLARRRAVLELKAQQSGNLGLVGADGVGPWFFRLFGGVIAAGGLLLLLVSVVSLTG